MNAWNNPLIIWWINWVFNYFTGKSYSLYFVKMYLSNSIFFWEWKRRFIVRLAITLLQVSGFRYTFLPYSFKRVELALINKSLVEAWNNLLTIWWIIAIFIYFKENITDCILLRCVFRTKFSFENRRDGSSVLQLSFVRFQDFETHSYLIYFKTCLINTSVVDVWNNSLVLSWINWIFKYFTGVL